MVVSHQPCGHCQLALGVKTGLVQPVEEVFFRCGGLRIQRSPRLVFVAVAHEAAQIERLVFAGRDRQNRVRAVRGFDRLRQIALRKIFGSGVKSAAWKLSKSFMLMTAVAVVIAIPVCIWSMRYYLADFYNAIAFPWWIILVAAALTFLISFVSIISRTWSSAAENPVEVLKQDN